MAFAPARWRARGALAQYVEGADHLTYALRNVRVLIRRVLTALGDGEAVPPVLPDSIKLLGDAVDLLREEWDKGAEPVAAASGRCGGGGVGSGVRRRGRLLRRVSWRSPHDGHRPAAGHRHRVPERRAWCAVGGVERPDAEGAPGRTEAPRSRRLRIGCA